MKHLQSHSKSRVVFAKLLPLLSTAAALLIAAESVSAQSYNVFFRSTDVKVVTGSTATFAIGMQNQPDPVTGFSLGVRHDAVALEFVEAVPGEAVEAALGGAMNDGDFFAVQKDPGGVAGVTVAMILSDPMNQSTNLVIPPGEDNEVVRLVYNVVATEEGSSTVDIAGDLGTPAVAVVLDLDGAARDVTEGGEGRTAQVTIETAINFLRGDVNQSGGLEVLDAIIILEFLFAPELMVPDVVQGVIDNCLVAFNADGSTDLGEDGAVEEPQDIQIPDAIKLVDVLFGGGELLPAPFPDCGVATTPASDRMVCTQFDSCLPQEP